MVIALVTTTLDGKIALSEDDQIKWHSDEDVRLFVEDTKMAGVVVMGSTTFKQIALRGRTLPKRKKVVLTRNPKEYREKYTEAKETEFTDDSPAMIVSRLTKAGHKDICVIGGGNIYTLFLNAQLIDEIRVTVSPYIFGSNAVSFISQVDNLPMKLSLVETTQLGDSFIRLRYRVAY